MIRPNSSTTLQIKAFESEPSPPCTQICREDTSTDYGNQSKTACKRCASLKEAKGTEIRLYKKKFWTYKAASWWIRELVCQGQFCLLWLDIALQNLKWKRFVTSASPWSISKCKELNLCAFWMLSTSKPYFSTTEMVKKMQMRIRRSFFQSRCPLTCLMAVRNPWGLKNPVIQKQFGRPSKIQLWNWWFLSRSSVNQKPRVLEAHDA